MTTTPTTAIKPETAIDNLFTHILNDGVDKPYYYQAKLDFVYERLAKKNILGYKIYKLYVAQALLSFQQNCFDDAAMAINEALDALAEHTMQLAYLNVVNSMNETINEVAAYVQKQNDITNIRSMGTKSLVIGIGLLIFGGIITAASYSSTDPGGTYVVTTGLFLVGGINVLVAIYRYIRWAVVATNFSIT
jgi:hypothetical protein